MNEVTHFKQLERMYLAAPINTIFPPKITVSEAVAEIQIYVKPEYFHSAGAVHGSVIFKLLDDVLFLRQILLNKQFSCLQRHSSSI
ncbi:MAG TPA: hypothetical protein PLU16_08135 [Gallionellaceae bacterium]|jgi:acyl-coenzyme A thioesterase PaaI-like protein|nr:hypothetical protein [Gallionellaceae bacterium]HQS75164.1 hypothetical protein [Gallionellaceae bacterium]